MPGMCGNLERDRNQHLGVDNKWIHETLRPFDSYSLVRYIEATKTGGGGVNYYISTHLFEYFADKDCPQNFGVCKEPCVKTGDDGFNSRRSRAGKRRRLNSPFHGVNIHTSLGRTAASTKRRVSRTTLPFVPIRLIGFGDTGRGAAYSGGCGGETRCKCIQSCAPRGPPKPSNEPWVLHRFFRRRL